MVVFVGLLFVILPSKGGSTQLHIITKFITHWLQLSALTAIMILLSSSTNHVAQHWQHTALASMYWTMLCLCDPPVFFWWGTRTVVLTHSAAAQLRYRLRGTLQRHDDDDDDDETSSHRSSRQQQQQQQQQDIVAQATAQLCVAVTIPCCILRVYDRGWQIQRWPVPLIVGSTYGWALGLCVGTMLCCSVAKRRKRPDYY